MTQHQRLQAQFQILAAIRDFFNSQGFQDVLTPPMVKNPGMETHIHPFRLQTAFKDLPTQYYLHTSPEFHMKELLSLGMENIFTLAYCFRDEPRSEIHRQQFIMLEWYRTNQFYTKIMDDMENLVSHSTQFLEQHNIQLKDNIKNISYQRSTIQDLFQDIINIDILTFLGTDDLYELIQKDFKDVPLPHKTLDKYSWDDLYFLLFLNTVEPVLKNYPYILLYEFPNHLSALSTIKTSDTRVCERFEVYMNGIELCNCFNELRDINEQQSRFNLQAQEKKSIYNYELSEPTILYESLERGLPTSTGIALGVERLLYALTSLKNTFWE